MIMLYFIICVVAVFLMFAVEDTPANTTIKIDDINVGDVIRIKGESFIVKEYSSNGFMEIDDADNETYIIKLDDNAIITSHNEGGKRKYISIDNFKGTVGGDYLNKFKLD